LPSLPGSMRHIFTWSLVFWVIRRLVSDQQFEKEH
jgi:hypothetical protein